MRFLAILVVLSGFASAQSDVSGMLARGLKEALKTMQAVPEADRTAILGATAELLTKHVTFRADGTSSSWQALSTRRAVEWKGLVVHHITSQAVTEADRLNGITKRYLVTFGCDAHRTWDHQANAWGQWLAIGNPSFPSGLVFEWKNNAWIARESAQLKLFSPGPGDAVITRQPHPKDTGLPPGMTRGQR